MRYRLAFLRRKFSGALEAISQTATFLLLNSGWQNEPKNQFPLERLHFFMSFPAARQR